MLTGDQYRESLRDGRASYLDGKLVEDAASHPLIGKSVDWIAKTYDRHHSGDPGAHNPMYDLPKTKEELQEQMDFLLASDPTAASTAGSMALRNVAPELGESQPGLSPAPRSLPRLLP